MKIKLILALLITSLIFTNSLMPGHVSSQQSGFFTTHIKEFLDSLGFILEIETISFFTRKLAHFIQFAIAGFLWYVAFEIKIRKQKVWILYVFLLGVMIALTDESIQYFIPNRSAQIRDVLIDVWGYMTGMIFKMILTSLIIERKKTHKISRFDYK